MFSLFLDLYQQYQISVLQAEARVDESEARRTVSHAALAQVRDLGERLDKLTLVTHAMWTLLSERTQITEEDLLRRITEIDARDGTVDGRVARQPVKCSCGAMVCAKFQRCLFCGKDYRGSGAFA